MKRRPTISGRITSIRHAFAHAIIPRGVDPVALADAYKIAGFEDGKCVYCVRDATDQDHLHPIVKDGRPSGHYHTNDNVVPSCGPCNQSKSGSDWKRWMERRAVAAPERSAEIAARVEALEKFEAHWRTANPPGSIDLQEAIGPELHEAYWSLLSEIEATCAEADQKAAEIRKKLGYAQ